MKILKIELQNINSLKSDQKIVIDFESDYFKDVGLFAITGATGSGKTTILDAITIALYHKVPRFNNAKNKLDQVVSFGASTAFSHVIFENKNEIFEANWSIRKISKSGKTLSNPQEEFRLLNLTTNNIVAEGKKEVEAKVVEVTQLNYNQFLRSMMLAQGEFAAFLSASTKDKGTLLEQITGEEIYKRIGAIIYNRLSEERKKYEKISHKLSDAILSEEEKQNNLDLQTKYELEVVNLSKELANLKRIEDWYTHQAQLEKDIINLKKESDNLELSQTKEKENIQLLEQHLKAEPFKEKVDTFRRVSNEIVDNQNNQNKFNLKLNDLVNKLKVIKDKEQKSLAQFTTIEITFQKWLPLFDVITTLDNSIAKDTIQQNLELKSITELNLKIEGLIQKQAKHSEQLTALIQKNNEINKRISEAQSTDKIAEKLTDWTTELKLIGYNFKQILTFKDFITERQSTLVSLEQNKKSQKEVIEKIKTDLDVVNQQIKRIETDSKTLNFESLLNEKEKLTAELNASHQFKIYSDDIQLKRTEIKTNDKIIDAKQLEYNANQKRLTDLLSTQKTLKTMVADAIEILKLTQTIKDLASERKKLKPGEACQLCGSTEHPLVEKYEALNFSKTEEELTKRQQDLEKVTQEFTILDRTTSESKVTIEFYKKNNIKFEAAVQKIKEHIKALPIDVKIDTQINVERIESITKSIENLELKLEKSKQLDLKKEELTKTFNRLTATLNSESQKNIQILEKEKHYKDELTKKQAELTILEKSNNLITGQLEKEFKEYELKMPIFGNYQTFINDLNQKVNTFKTLETEKQNLIKQSDTLNQSLIHGKENLIQLKELLGKHLKNKDKLQIDIDKDKAERIKLLPLSISVSDKQNELQTQNNTAKNEHQALKNEVDALEKQETELTTELKALQTKKTALNNLFETIEKSLKLSLESSDFNTIETVEQALLSVSKKNELTQIKTKLNNESIRLKALDHKIEENKAKQLKNKTFTLDETQVELALTKLNLEKETILKTVGELNQKLITDAENIKKNKAIVKELDSQKKIINKWDTLLKLLGGSKDSFNTYVQRLTLQNLITLANNHLSLLNNRYSLKLNEVFKTGEELNFKLIDHYQTDKARNIDTSSGGEKFIISLALALGLSDLSSSNVKIQSLFIDEGFGTLDNTTLETVISTLETLQSQGKKIGVISHVESLKERISTQIQIAKKSNGVSELQIVQN